jgi:hypothetical protein
MRKDGAKPVNSVFSSVGTTANFSITGGVETLSLSPIEAMFTHESQAYPYGFSTSTNGSSASVVLHESTLSPALFTITTFLKNNLKAVI